MDRRVHGISRGIGLFSALAAVFLITSFSIAEDINGGSYFRGVEYAAQGKLEEANQEYQKALANEAYYAASKLEIHAIADVLNQKAERNAALLVFEGKRYAIEQKWREAIDLYGKAIKQNPSYGYAFISRGIAYGSQGLFDKAISDFSEALDVFPQYTEAYNNRGVIYEYKGKYNNAISDFTKAIEFDPSCARLYYNRALAHSYKKLYGAAETDFDKAIELKPDYSKAYLGKAIACEKAGFKDKAIAAYKKAIEYDKSKDPEMLEYVNESIRKLEGSLQ